MPNRKLDAVEAGLRRLIASLDEESREIKKAERTKVEAKRIMKILKSKLAPGRK
jgi:hypothetical protein